MGKCGLSAESAWKQHMKILMINSVCGIRSTGRICTDLAVELEKQGHEVKIAFGRETVPAPFERFAVRIGSDTGVKLHAIRARAFDDMGFGSKAATRRLIDRIRQYDPDVIHLHNIHGYYLHIAVLFDYLKTCGKKIIWTLHDCWPFTGHSAYCEAAACAKWKTGCFDCPGTRQYPQAFTDGSQRNWRRKKALFTAVPQLTIVTPSHWLKELVGASFLREYPVKVIHNGIDTDVFHPVKSDVKEQYGLQDTRMILGVAAAWEKRKGLDDFILLAEKLRGDGTVVLVGLSEEQEKALLQGIVSVRVGNDVKKLAALYAAADVLVNPTYEDNYPTVNLEAIACGTPVVTYDTGGSPESASQFGAVVAKGDIDGLKREIMRLSADSRPNACDKAFFDKRTAILQYMQLYKA